MHPHLHTHTFSSASPLHSPLLLSSCVCVSLSPPQKKGATGPPKHTPTVEEGRMWRGSQYWLAGTAAAVGAYVLLGGHYFTITTMEDDGEVIEEEVDDDGDDDGVE